MSTQNVTATQERCVEVLEMLVDALGLDDVEPGELNYEAPLFASQDDLGEGLELDSVDALEVVVAIKSNYGIKMTDEDKKSLYSIQTIADFLDQKVSGVE